MSKSMIKQCEENIINQAMLLDETLNYLDVLRNVSYKLFDTNFRQTDPDYLKFSTGIQQAREAVYAKSCEKIRDCFMLVGVGGEKAAEFCRQKAEERFGNKQYEIMSFLDKHGHVPSRVSSEDIEKLRQEINAQLQRP